MPITPKTGSLFHAYPQAETASALYNRQKASLGELTLKSEPGPPITLGNAAAALVWLLVLHPGLALSVCSTRAIDIICPPAGVCPNTRSGHGGGY
jgi:hypothetical protein